jgi:hypothetical protein
MRPPTLRGSPSRMLASSSRSTGKARSIAAGPRPSWASSCSASSSSPSQPRCRRATTNSRASSAAPSTRCMTAAMTPSPASCSESSSAPTRRSRSTTARPSPRYTAARRAERCSFESISLCVVLRCPAQAVAHHPRRERRSWGPGPAATHLSAFSEVMGPLPVHVSEATPAGHYARSGRRDAANPRSSVSSRRLGGAHSSVVANSHDHTVDVTVAIECDEGGRALRAGSLAGEQEVGPPRRKLMVRRAR